jgi:hypothetical protein
MASAPGNGVGFSFPLLFSRILFLDLRHNVTIKRYLRYNVSYAALLLARSATKSGCDFLTLFASNVTGCLMRLEATGRTQSHCDVT